MGDADMFWTSPRVKQLYMNHVRVLFNRRNVYTGLLYKVRSNSLEFCTLLSLFACRLILMYENHMPNSCQTFISLLSRQQARVADPS